MVTSSVLIGLSAQASVIEPYTQWMAIIVFAVTYVVIGIGKLPPFRIDRAGAALLGAALMITCGAMTLVDAWWHH